MTGAPSLVRTTVRPGSLRANDNETVVPSGAPAANGANPVDPSAIPAANTAPPAQTPASSASPTPDPTLQALQNGRTDYRQRMIGTLQRLGIPLVDGAPGKPSVNKSLEAAARQIAELRAKVEANSGLDEAEKARIGTLEQQIAEWKKKAEEAETEKTTFIRRQEVASAISGQEAPGALDHAVSAFLADYQIVDGASGRYYSYQNAPLVNRTTGQMMALPEVVAHMMARYPYLARPGAQPGVAAVGQATGGTQTISGQGIITASPEDIISGKVKLGE